MTQKQISFLGAFGDVHNMKEKFNNIHPRTQISKQIWISFFAKKIRSKVIGEEQWSYHSMVSFYLDITKSWIHIMNQKKQYFLQLVKATMWCSQEFWRTLSVKTQFRFQLGKWRYSNQDIKWLQSASLQSLILFPGISIRSLRFRYTFVFISWIR